MVAAVVGLVLGTVLGNGGNALVPEPTDPPTNQPTNQLASEPSNVFTWNQVSQTLKGKAAKDSSGCSVALSANGVVLATGGNKVAGLMAGHA